MEFLDVMLRFGTRQPEVERQLANLGYEVIIPRGLRGRGERCFQIALTAGDRFSDFKVLVDQVRMDLVPLGSVLQNLSASVGPDVAELDFGIGAPADLAICSYKFPSAFLALLSDFGIELCLSIYYP